MFQFDNILRVELNLNICYRRRNANWPHSGVAHSNLTVMWGSIQGPVLLGVESAMRCDTYDAID